MENTIEGKIEDLSQHGYRFELGEYVNKGWQIFKADMGKFVAFVLLSFLIQMTAGVIPVVGSFAGILLAPLSLGFAIVADRINHNETYKFDQFFDGFKKYSEVLVVMLLLVLFFIIAMIPAIAIMIASFSDLDALSSLPDPNSDPLGFYTIFFEMFNFGWLFVSLIPVFILMLLLNFSLYFAYFYKLGAMDCVKASFNVCKKNLVGFFLLGIVNAFIMIGGLLLFFVGYFFAAALVQIINFVAFDEIVGARVGEGDDEDDELLQHLLEEGFR